MGSISARFRISVYVVILALTLLSQSNPWGSPQAAEPEDKEQNAQQVKYEPFGFTVDPLKKAYLVGETMRFQVRGDRPFYLYLFSIDRKAGVAAMILPNARQMTNRYEANASFEVPEKGVEFYRDQAGREEVLFVATSEVQKFDTSSYRRSGDTLIGSVTILDAQIDELKRKGRKASGYFPVVRTVELDIKDPSTVPPDNRRPIIFIASNQSQFRADEPVKVVFGADTPGWVHVYTAVGNEAATLLQTQAITGESVHSLIVPPDNRIGNHSVIAVYSDHENLEEGKANGPEAKLDTASKGLRVIDPQQRTTASDAKAVFYYVVQ